MKALGLACLIFSTLTPVAVGTTPKKITLKNQKLRGIQIGFLWEGFLYVPVNGTYTFKNLLR